jgi:hypothetical protein
MLKGKKSEVPEANIFMQTIALPAAGLPCGLRRGAELSYFSIVVYEA